MRILGITIPNDKQLQIGLTSIYGVGRPTAFAILTKLGVDPEAKPDSVSEEIEAKIRTEIEALKTEGDLKREVSANIKRLKDIKSYKGSRHAARITVRGQRSKTNSRTVRGNVRKTMASGRRKVEKT